MAFENGHYRPDRKNSPKNGAILSHIGAGLDKVRESLQALFGNGSQNKRMSREQILKRQAINWPRTDKSKVLGSPTTQHGPTAQSDPTVRRNILLGLGAVLVVAGGGGILALGGQPPAIPHKQPHKGPGTPEKSPEKYPAASELFNAAVAAQEKILNTEADERTAYYLDTGLKIVDSAPYKILTVDPQKPDAKIPDGVIAVPAKTIDQSHKEYGQIKAATINAWHDRNRRKYSIRTGAGINPHKDDPMVNVSPPEGSTFPDVWKRAQSHIDGVQAVFEKTFKKTRLYQDMPAPARAEMIRVCTQGQVSNESQWSPNLTSHSQEPALGPWQIKNSTAEDSIRKNQDKLTVEAGEDGYSLFNFADSTMTAVMYYEQIYATLKPTFAKVQAQYQLSDENFYTNFVIPCLINAYHNGQGGMSKVINWFLDSYTTEKIKKNLGPDANNYGHNLYFLMTQCYFIHGNDGNFSKKSFQYVPKCYAYASLIDKEKTD